MTTDLSALSRPSDTAMARALPGQTDADPGLIEEALADINAAHDRGGLATMRAIATILLDKMFRDDARAFLETAHAHASFLALAGHPGLAVSKSALWYSVVIEDNFRLFGDLGDELTVSHHKRLSHVPEEDARVALARQVVERRWTVAERNYRQNSASSRGAAPVKKLARGVAKRIRTGAVHARCESDHSAHVPMGHNSPVDTCKRGAAAANTGAFVPQPCTRRGPRSHLAADGGQAGGGLTGADQF